MIRIGFNMSFGILEGEEYLYEKDPEQYKIMAELRENMECEDPDFEEKSESLDSDF